MTRWVLTFCVVSNVFLWIALAFCMTAVNEWMDAMKDAYDEHQHIKDRGAGYATLSGPPLSSTGSNSACTDGVQE